MGDNFDVDILVLATCIVGFVFCAIDLFELWN